MENLMQILPKKVKIKKSFVSTSSRGSAEKVFLVLNALGISGLTESVVVDALNGKSTVIDSVIDVDLLENSKIAKIPAIYFFLTTIGFRPDQNFDRVWKKQLDKAKAIMSEVDGKVYASAHQETLPLTERVVGFTRGLLSIFPAVKLTSSGSKIIALCNNIDCCTKNEREKIESLCLGFGLSICGKECGKLVFKLLPEKQYFNVTAATMFARFNSLEVSPIKALTEFLHKLDTKVRVLVEEGNFYAISERFSSERLDDAFERMGKKCGLKWIGRNKKGWATWQCGKKCSPGGYALASTKSKKFQELKKRFNK